MLPRFLIVTTAVYLRLVLNYVVTLLIKVDPLNLESQNQAKKIPVVL